MKRRMKFGLIFILAAVGAGGVIGQPPIDERLAVPAEIQPVQTLEPPTTARPGRGYWNGQLTSQTGPVALPTPVEARPVASLPPQPPTPSVALTVLIPRDHAPGQDIPCTIKATNSSGGDAHRVIVRIAEIDGATLVAGDPRPEPKVEGVVDWKWNLKTIKANETQKIELKLRPIANAASVSVKAFVSFEHGQTVKTLSEFGEHAETWAAQSQVVLARAQRFKRERLGPAYYANMDRKLGAHSLMLVACREERMVAHGMVLTDSENTIATFFGREAGRPSAEWFSLMNEVIKLGIERQSRYIHLGLGSYDAKALVGADIEPLYLYCRTRFAPLNWLIRMVPELMGQRGKAHKQIFRD